MKKILLVGELNQIMGSLNDYLSEKYRVQMCVENQDLVKGMTKLFKPDLVIFSLIGVGEMDRKISHFFLETYPNTKVLFVGTQEECQTYSSFYEKEQFDYLTRPTTLGMLFQKCEELLGEEEGNESIDKIQQEPIKEVSSEALERKEQGEKCGVLKEEEVEKKRILAVDDSGILLRSVKAALENTYEVMVANSGMMAIKQAKKKLPDLILLDYEMPEWDGRKTLEEIRKDEELKDIPVVFLTAVREREHIAAVLKLRPSGYLLKPIEPQILIDSIEKAMVRI